MKAHVLNLVWLVLGLTVWMPLLMFAFTELVDVAWWWFRSKTPGRDGYKWFHRND